MSRDKILGKHCDMKNFIFEIFPNQKWPSVSRNRTQKRGRNIVTSRKTRFSIRGIHHLLPDKILARNDASRRLQARAGVPSKKQLISEPKLKKPKLRELFIEPENTVRDMPSKKIWTRVKVEKFSERIKKTVTESSH